MLCTSSGHTGPFGQTPGWLSMLCTPCGHTFASWRNTESLLPFSIARVTRPRLSSTHGGKSRCEFVSVFRRPGRRDALPKRMTWGTPLAILVISITKPVSKPPISCAMLCVSSSISRSIATRFRSDTIEPSVCAHGASMLSGSRRDSHPALHIGHSILPNIHDVTNAKKLKRCLHGSRATVAHGASGNGTGSTTNSLWFSLIFSSVSGHSSSSSSGHTQSSAATARPHVPMTSRRTHVPAVPDMYCTGRRMLACHCSVLKCMTVSRYAKRTCLCDTHRPASAADEPS